VHTQLSTGRRNNHSVCMYDRFRFWSHATKFLQGGWILLLLLVPGLFAQKALADGTVQISNTNLVSFKGWGIFPAPYDRQMPTYADGSLAYGDASWLPATGALSSGNVFAALRDSGVQIARVYITPTIGKRDNTLDPNQLQDLKDHLTSLQNAGITQYVVTIWSPPAYMKLPDHVRYGTYNNNHEYLAPAYANGSGYDFAHFYVAVLAKLKEAGFPAPLAISIQNEPDSNAAYDASGYMDNDSEKQTWRNVIKQLRKKLKAKNNSWFGNIRIIGPETSGWDDMDQLLGMASSSGFAAMNADSDFANAIGGFAYHSYATSGRISPLDQAMAAYPGRNRWMTEYSTDTGIRPELRPNSGVDQLNWTLNFVRRMAGDLVDFKTNYWFFWRFWHSSSSADDQDLVYGDGQKTKAYYVFQKLWSTVHSGWKVKQTNTTDPDLRADNSGLIQSGSGDQWSAPVDILAFESPAADQSFVMLVNNGSSSKNITSLSGLDGSQANIFVTTTSQDMAQQQSRPVSGGTLGNGNLTLPPYSITFVSTGG